MFVYGTHLIILGQLVVRHREEPGGSLQRVGAARLEVEGAQAPVLQLTHKVLGTDTFSEVKLPLAVKAEDVLKYPGRSVEVELPTHQTERVTKAENLG